MRTTLITLALLSLATKVFAQTEPDCATIAPAGGEVVYVGGSTALGPLIKTLGPKLAADTTSPIMLVYTGDGDFGTNASPASCDGVNAIAGDGTSAYVVPAGVKLAYYPDTTGTKKLCVTSQTTQIDLGVSDVFVPQCTRANKPATVGDFTPATQAMLFAAPKASTQSAITAEEAYLVFGFGADPAHAVAPWTDPNQLFIRKSGSGTRRLLAATIKVDYAKWKGKEQAKTGDVYTALKTSQSPEAAIGIIGADYLDDNSTEDRRASVKALAFRAYGQRFAYFPDTSDASRDKKNVRDGHYAAWGYVHLLAKLTAAGTGTNDDTSLIQKPSVKRIVQLLLGTVSSAGFDVVGTFKASNLIPLCAMKVKRTDDGADLAPYTATTDCTCAYEKLFGAPTTTGCN
jgi:hypothetical protein